MGHITVKELLDNSEEDLDIMCKERVEQWKIETPNPEPVTVKKSYSEVVKGN